jgi:hypothetical protein
VIAIGSDGIMAAVAQARHGILAKRLKPEHPPRHAGEGREGAPLSVASVVRS